MSPDSCWESEASFSTEAPRVSGPSGLRLRLLSPPSERGSRVTHDDVLFGYRLQLFALVAERGVSEEAG